MAANIYMNGRRDHLGLEGAIYFMFDQDYMYFIVTEFYSNLFYFSALYRAAQYLKKKDIPPELIVEVLLLSSWVNLSSTLAQITDL